MRLFRLLIFASFTPQFIVGSPKVGTTTQHTSLTHTQGSKAFRVCVCVCVCVQVYAPDGMGVDGSADWQMNANDKNTKAVAKQAKILQGQLALPCLRVTHMDGSLCVCVCDVRYACPWHGQHDRPHRRAEHDPAGPLPARA